MADETEVVYSYVGDVSSLREATKEAISLLDHYDNTLKRMASSPDFGASKTATTNFQRSISGMIKQVNSLTKSINTVGSSVDKSIPDGAALMSSVTKDLADVLRFLDSSTKVTSDDLKILTQIMKEARVSIDSVTAKAQLLSSNMKPLEQMSVSRSLDKASASAEKAEKHYNRAAQAGFRIQEAYQLSNKSAAESAAVFIRAGKSAEKLTGVQSVVQRIRTEMQMLGAQAAMAWQKFASYIDPTGNKIRSLQSKTSESLGKMKSVIAKVSSAFRRNTTEADDNSNSYDNLSKSAKSLLGILSSIGSRARNTSGNFGVLANSVKILNRAFYSLIGVNIGRWLTEAAKQSISYAENVNLFTVAMGDSLDVGTEFINQMAEIYGMDPSNLMRYAGNFYQLADAIDMPDKSAATLSLSLIKATNDISSLFNIPIETVFNDLSSGIQGMSRAVRKYGMDIRATTLQQTALSFGITEQVENMSEANRQGLRFLTMMRQASNASGDFARTIESPANQLKIFKEQMSQLGRAIGNLFIRPLTTAIQYINGFVMALRMAVSFIGSILGLVNNVSGGSTDAANDVAKSVHNIGAAAGGAAKELKGMLAPFDELNVLNDSKDSGGGGDGGALDSDILDPAIADAIASMELKLEDIRMKALDVRDALLSFFGFKIDENSIISWDADTFEQNLIDKFPQWTQTIQATFDNWSEIVNGFINVLNALGDVAQAVWDKVAGFFNKFVNDESVSSFIEGLSESLNNFASFLSTNKDTIADFAIALVVLSAAFKGFSNISSLIGPIATFISTCASALAPFAAVIGWASAIVATIGVLYVSSDTFAISFNNLIASVGEGLLSVFTAFWEALQVVWAGIQTLWADNIQPMLTAIGDAVAPVVDTIVALWEDLVDIVVDVFDMIAGLWTSVLQPALAAFFDAISNLAKIFGTLWSEVIGPVVEHIGDGIKTLWETTLRPIFENLVAIIGGVIEIILALWNNVLAPVVNWLIYVLAPIFVNVFNTIWDIIQEVVEGIGQSINGVLEILRGVIDFIVGVFTGDWDRAWQGIVGIFEGIWDTLAGIVKTVLNVVIGVINVALGAISGAINSIIRAVNKISFKAPDWVPGVGGKTLGFNIKEVGTWSIPHLATGGVVTSPTMAMISEGKYDEAVIPLGNSPQMRELIDQIAEASRSRGDDTPVQVQVYIGNEQVAEYMHRANRRYQLQTNGG